VVCELKDAQQLEVTRERLEPVDPTPSGLFDKVTTEVVAVIVLRINKKSSVLTVYRHVHRDNMVTQWAWI
jgi:hypothetical protein